MIVRALDGNNDWTFGQSKANYIGKNPAIAQCIQTRISCFIGNCYFDMGAGVDWLNFLAGSKNQLALELAVSAVILNSYGVIGVETAFCHSRCYSKHNHCVRCFNYLSGNFIEFYYYFD